MSDNIEHRAFWGGARSGRTQMALQSIALAEAVTMFAGATIESAGGKRLNTEEIKAGFDALRKTVIESCANRVSYAPVAQRPYTHTEAAISIDEARKYYHENFSTLLMEMAKRSYPMQPSASQSTPPIPGGDE